MTDERKPYLTDEEIEEITKPLTQGAARCRYFEKIGCKVDPKPNGQPHVGRAEYEASRMAQGRGVAPASGDNVVALNRDALRELQDRKRRPPRAA